VGEDEQTLTHIHDKDMDALWLMENANNFLQCQNQTTATFDPLKRLNASKGQVLQFTLRNVVSR
jgi:hypothetical protein